VLRPQYKFIVDGEWKYAADQTVMYDEQGNVNNVLEVQEYVPENLESLSSFDPPASPVSRRVSQDAGLTSASGLLLVGGLSRSNTRTANGPPLGVSASLMPHTKRDSADPLMSCALRPTPRADQCVP